MQNIIDALKKLDVSNDNHWTVDGQPRLDTVKMLASDPSVTRDTLNAVAPDFNRETAANWEPKQTEGQVQTPSDNQQGTENQPQENSVTATGTSVDAGSERQDPETKPEEKVEETNIEALEKALADAEAKTNEKLLAKEQAEADYVAALQEEDAARLALDAAKPKTDDLDPVRGYLNAQLEANKERSRVVEALREAGVTPEVLQKLAGVNPTDLAYSTKK